MPFTVNGIGTWNYGERDYRPDGSFITTQWFVLFFVPIFPIRSLRIVVPGKLKFLATRYSIIDYPKLNWNQALCVYAWFVVVLLSLILSMAYRSWWLAIPGLIAVATPIVLRRRAFKRITELHHRRQMGMSHTTTD